VTKNMTQGLSKQGEKFKGKKDFSLDKTVGLGRRTFTGCGRILRIAAEKVHRLLASNRKKRKEKDLYRQRDRGSDRLY